MVCFFPKIIYQAEDGVQLYVLLENNSRLGYRKTAEGRASAM